MDINLENLANAISSEAPCGDNLEEDALFLQLEIAFNYIPERQRTDGVTEPEKEPDWKQVRDLALELLQRTRDVQVAVKLLCALIRLEGFIGLEQGLTLLVRWLEQFWPDVYPRQDADDEYPMQRINTLTTLNDYKLLIDPIKRINLTESPLGQFCWRDIEIAKGQLQPTDDEPVPETSLIDAAFEATDVTSLNRTYDSVQQSLKLLNQLLTLIADNIGNSYAPDLTSLKNILQHISALLTEKLQNRMPQTDSATEGEPELMATAVDGHSAPPVKTLQNRGIHDRQDVIKAIDDICRYFDRYEPSSPVPYLLLRAKRLLSMNFMEILRDLTPDAIQQAENICGKQNED